MASHEGAGSPPNVAVADTLQHDSASQHDSHIDASEPGAVVENLPENGDALNHSDISNGDESESNRMAVLVDNSPPIIPCPYRSEEFRQDECARFWDCPSHQVARVVEEEGHTHNTSEGSAGQQLPNDVSSSRHTAYNRSGAPQAESSTEVPEAHAEIGTEEATVSSVASSPEHHELSITSRTSVPSAQSGDQSISGTDTTATIHPQGAQSAHDHESISSSGGAAIQATFGRSSRSAHAYGLTGQSSAPSGTQPDVLDSPPSFFSTIAAQQENRRVRGGEFTIPTWQPDSEVTSCPICHVDFGLFNRRHHCRKCGRVVCNNCSPHRIVIPHQYIVRPPDEASTAAMTGQHGIERGLADFDVSLGGGRSVRLCNPCVPDPNTTPPPQYPSPTAAIDTFSSPRLGHQRSQSSAAGTSESIGMAYQARGSLQSRASMLHTTQRQASSTVSRSRSATVNHLPSHGGSSILQDSAYRPLLNPLGHRYPRSSRAGQLDRQVLEALQFPGASPSSTGRSAFGSQNSNASSSAAAGNVHRPLPPPPRIPEEDQCPICHYELPSRNLPEFERLREEHITACIDEHSTARHDPPTPGQANAPGTSPARALRPTGMISYLATEKDKASGDECGICFDEYDLGVKMARLECWCRFHYDCIVEWFERKGIGRCPVHQHDDYGY